MVRNYLKVAWKVLRRRPFFTFVSLFGIAFTLTVLTVATAFLDNVFASYPPETKLDRTVGIYYAELHGPTMHRNGGPGFGLLDQYARGLPNVELVSIASTFQGAVSYLNGVKVRSYLKFTDAEFWQMMDFEFVEGGPFTPDDVARGARVAVINVTTRQRFFGGAPAVGRTLEVDGQRYRVAGVVPDVPMLRLVPFADIWVPHTTAKSDSYQRELSGNFMGLLLLRDPARLDETRQEFASRLARIEFPDPRGFRMVSATPETAFDGVARVFFGGGRSRASETAMEDPNWKPTAEVPPSRGATLVAFLAVAACLFMLLPAVNLVNLNVSRIMERAGEIGVRKAFGASSLTLVGQFVVENVLLTVLGGLLGFVFSWWALSFINASGVIPYASLQVNYRVFAYGLALAVFFGVVSGVYPAWRMARLDPVQALKGAGR